MSENRFVAEQVDVVNEDETEVWDIVFDTENTYAFMVRDTGTASDLCDLLNEQQATIDEQKIIIEERDLANERLNRFLIEIGLEKEYIKWEFKKRCVE